MLPNWMTRSTTDVTKPVKASMPLPSAASAVLALDELSPYGGSSGLFSSHWANTMLARRASST